MADPTLGDEQWKTVREAVDDLAPHYEQALQELVRIPSTLGNEAEAQQLVAELATEAGLDTELWQVDPATLATHPDFGTVDGGSEPRPNVAAVLRGSGGGRSMIVSGHVDVVPPEPLGLWAHSPWAAVIEGDRMYGRGAYDMKGGLVAGLHAIHAVTQAAAPLRGDLTFESVIEEECTGNGELAARLRGPGADAAVITEPTDGTNFQAATPGVIWFEVTTEGRPGYVGRRGEGVNAIDVAMQVAEHLRSLPGEFNKSFSHPLFSTVDDPLTLNTGTISSGNWPSTVPLTCTVGFRLSFPIGWTVRQAEMAVRDHLAHTAASDPWLVNHPPKLRFHGFRAVGWSLSPDAPIAATLGESVHAVTGDTARPIPAFGTNDARYFAAAGIDAVVFGPEGGNIHAPDEWVSLSSCHRVTAVLARTIMEWCR